MNNKVALVTGASRGAGRGIALELALDGYVVYLSGRSRDDNSTTQYSMATLDETQRIIAQEGGEAIPITCDHRNEEEIINLFETIKEDQGRLDLLVNNVWMGYMGKEKNLDGLDDFTEAFWNQPDWRYDNMMASARSHYLSSVQAALMMKEQKSGCIINTSFWDEYKYLSNLPYDLSKTMINRMVYGMAIELREYQVATILLSLGWIRTEHLKTMFDLDDYNYLNKEGFETTESTRYAGRAIVALMNDPNLIDLSGKIMTTGELAQKYGFTDLDGTQPSNFKIPDPSKGLKQR
ncbi:MAG: SDR family NAD(P)-dependent oxidoreductase [Candidatus Heimdallarchaeota archaeon]|nr:SDR family NAD(P)-dependent oxidoreductase [Candidatus Heimdallarchaeota archaeon]